jgi:type IV secretion system protein VirD4
MQMPADDALILVAGAPPIRAQKMRYYEDSALKVRLLPPPELDEKGFQDLPPARNNVWSNTACSPVDVAAPAPSPQASSGDRDLDRTPGDEAPRRTAPQERTDALNLGPDDDDLAQDPKALTQTGPARMTFAASRRPAQLQLELPR